MVEKTVDPLMHGVIIPIPTGEMLGARPRAGHGHALMGAGGPAAHHRIGHFGVELQAEGLGAFHDKSLFGENVALGQRGGGGRDVKAVTMPMIDMAGPLQTGLLTEGKTVLRGAQRIIADLGHAFLMGINARAGAFGKQLRTQAEA